MDIHVNTYLDQISWYLKESSRIINPKNRLIDWHTNSSYKIKNLWKILNSHNPYIHHSFLGVGRGVASHFTWRVPEIGAAFAVPGSKCWINIKCSRYSCVSIHSNLWKWGVSRNSNVYTWWSNLLHTGKGYHGNIHEACRSKCNGDIFGLRRTSVCYENFICGISDGIITCAIISWIKYKHMCERDDTCDSIHAKGY